jgi:TRAP-type mannitol/chloroaromatic compound transport system substrate-binding protein
MKKKVLLIFLAIVLVVPLAGFAACEGEEASTEVAELEERIADLEAEIADLEAQIEELEAPPEVIEWDVATICLRGTTCFDMHYAPIESFIKMSNGRIKVNYYGGGEIVEFTEILEAVSRGTLDMSVVIPGYVTGLITLGTIEYGFPGVLEDYRDWSTLLHQFGLLDILRRAYAELNVYYIPINSDKAVDILSNKRLVTVDDFEGTNIRAIGGMAEVLDKLGAAVTYIPAADLHTSMATGVIDAVSYGKAMDMCDIGLDEVSKYLTYPSIMPYHTGAWIVNMDSWNALPDDMKEMLERVMWDGYEAIGEVGGLENLMQAESMAEMEAAGIELVALDEECMAAIRQATMEVLEELAAEDPYCAEAVEAIKAFMQAMGRL